MKIKFWCNFWNRTCTKEVGLYFMHTFCHENILINECAPMLMLCTMEDGKIMGYS